jgi:hypothetical protein
LGAGFDAGFDAGFGAELPALVAGFVFTAGTFPVDAFEADAFEADAFRATFEAAGFDAADFEADAFEFADLEPILGAEDLPDLPDISFITPCAEVTFKYKLFCLLNQALL